MTTEYREMPGVHFMPNPWLTSERLHYNRRDVRMPTCIDPALDPGALRYRLGERTRTPHGYRRGIPYCLCHASRA